MVKCVSTLTIIILVRYGEGQAQIIFIDWCFQVCPELPSVGFIDPPQCFGKYEYLREDDTVAAYRKYYAIAKQYDKNGKPMLKYTPPGEKPVWLE